MRTPTTSRVGRYERYRRTRSVGALEPPTYEESEEASAQSVSNLETPLPPYEEALLRSTSLHDLLHQDDPARVALPTIPVDWNRAGPSLENGARHLSTSSTDPDDTWFSKLCYSCCYPSLPCLSLITFIIINYFKRSRRSLSVDMLSSQEIQQTLPLPPCPPSYSQISSRRQTVSTRPPRPPSYEDTISLENIEPAAGNQTSSSDMRPAAPPPSEAEPSTSSGDSPSSTAREETFLDFPEDYWTSQLNTVDPRSPSSLSLIATCGAPSEHSFRVKSSKRVAIWKTTLSYGTYICAILVLLILYTVFLVFVCRSLNVVTIIMVTVLYLGVGFLIWVCYLVLKAILERLWKE